MNFLNLVFSIMILIQFSFGQGEREVLEEIEALWSSRQIEYDEYLWLKEWSKDQVAHCEELTQYLHLECQRSSTIHRQRVNWRYSQGDHRYEYSGQSPSKTWRQSLLTSRNEEIGRTEIQNQRSYFQWKSSDHRGDALHYTGGGFHPVFHLRPLSMDDFQSAWQINRYFQGSQVTWQKDAYTQLTSGYSGHFTSLESQQLLFNSMTLSPHDSSQYVFIAHQYFQFNSQQVHDYHIAWSQTHSKAKLTLLKGHQYHGFASSFQSENWKSQSQVIQAKDLPPLISIPYLDNQVDSTREIIDYQWKHSWSLQPFKFSHGFHAIHRVKGYFKNEVEVTVNPKWKYAYSHRSPHPDSFKELSHHTKAIHGNWHHDFYWPLWRVRHVYTWRPYPQHLFTSRIAVIWKASESRNLYISTRSQYPHLEKGRMEFQIQWRQRWKAALDQIWLKLSYRLDW